MGGMAIAAVLYDWLMLPEMRSALFLVALIAIVVDRGGSKHGFGAGAVRVMAVGARGFAFQNGMARGQSKLSLLSRVATGAIVQLSVRGQHGVTGSVAVVAATAGQVFLLVDAAQPKHLGFFLVAGQTGGVTLLRRRVPFGAEAHIWRILGRAPLMRVTSAVTAHAASSAAARELTVGGFKYGMYGLIGRVPMAH